MTNSNGGQLVPLPRGLCTSLGGKYVTCVSVWGVGMSHSTKLEGDGLPKEGGHPRRFCGQE